MTYAELKDEIIKIMKNMNAFDFQNAYEYACEWFDETPMYSPMAGLAYLETGEAELSEEFRQSLKTVLILILTTNIITQITLESIIRLILMK